MDVATIAMPAYTERRALLSFFARAGPPFLPPRRPSATAAGFLPSSSGVSPSGTSGWPSDVASLTISLASLLISRVFFFFFLLERLGTTKVYPKAVHGQEKSSESR